MTHITLETPKSIRVPAIRLPQLKIGSFFAALAVGAAAYAKSYADAVNVATFCSPPPAKPDRWETDY